MTDYFKLTDNPHGPIAIVEWLRGRRVMSTFMRNAGLGIKHLGVTERVAIDYRPGEVVDEERVMRAVNGMIEQLDAENSEIEISNPRVLQILPGDP